MYNRLPFDEIAVLGTSIKQFVVCPVVDNLVIIYDHNLASALDGRQPVRNNYDRAANHRLLNGFLHQMLRGRVQCTGCLIQ